MRFIRLLGAVVIFYGLSYLLHAGMQIASGMYVGRFPIPWVLIIVLNLTIGFVTAVNGVGLLLTRAWSRIAWLVTVTVLVLLHDLILLLWYLLKQDLTGQLLNVLLIFFLAVISWGKLTDESTKKYFTPT